MSEVTERMLPEKMSAQLSSEQSIGDVRITQLDCVEESSTGEVPRLQKFCRHKYWHCADYIGTLSFPIT